MSTLTAWLRPIVGIPRGDLDNARGWRKRAEHPFPGADDSQEEVAGARRAPEARGR